MSERKLDHVCNILDAVETLSSIVDLDIGAEKLGLISRENLNVLGKDYTIQRIQWLGQQNSDETLDLLKSSYKEVLHYLKQFYHQHKKGADTEGLFEGVNTLMNLVGEASQKLQRCTNIFKGMQIHLVEDLQEYKELKNFYSEKIFKLTKTGYTWDQLMAISQQALKDRRILRARPRRSRIDVEDMLIDIEAVKEDKDYELLYLRKEDGSRFFDRELIKNIRLICEFGQHFEDYHGDDPLVHVKLWQEKMLQLTARMILDSCRSGIQSFYKDYKRFKDIELVSIMNRAFMALMLSANPRNMLKNSPVKCCFQYFSDFHHFFHTALTSRDYQKFVAYPPNSSQKYLNNLLDLIHSVCRSLFTHMQGVQQLVGITAHLLEFEETENFESDVLSKDLGECFDKINELLSRHPNGPLFKVLDLFIDMDEEQTSTFDPTTQQNFPYKLYDLYLKDHEVSVLYLPSPTRQEIIQQAEILEEFKGFLRSYAHDTIEKKHLMFNLQNRTSWREYARCHVLEELQVRAEHSLNLFVISLPKNTEFYHQLYPYDRLHLSTEFIDQFIQHLMDDSTGFYFSRAMRKVFNHEFFEILLKGVLKVFFNNSSNLRRQQRLDFIEITYLLIQLKALEEVLPNSMSFTCKDGLDIGAMSNTLLFSFIKSIQGQEVSQRERDLLHAMLFSPPLMIRERNINSEAFDRLYSVLQLLERCFQKRDLRDELRKEFKGIFQLLAFDSVLKVPVPKKNLLML